MNKWQALRRKYLPAIALVSSSFALAAQQQPAASQGGPVQMVVSAEPRHGSDVPVIQREDVQVVEGHDNDQIQDWRPLQAGNSKVELFVLIDDAANITDVGTQLKEIAAFINQLPASMGVGVGYMRNGTVMLTQNLTPDHALAAKSLRLPIGDPGASASPYFSLTDLIKRWPSGGAVREVLMITDGIDRYFEGPSDPYVDQSVEQAQRAGIVVNAIYMPAAGHFGHTFWRQNWGQINLSKITDQTGGELYWQGFSPPVSFQPYLKDLSARLNHQYLVTFIPKPEKKSGMRRVKVETKVPNVELVAPDQVYVPESK
jgi:hypothetical protein